MFTCTVCPKSFEKESSLRGHVTRTKHVQSKIPQTGLFWHVHHSLQIAEWCHGYDERVKFILERKHSSEHMTRLRWFTPVKSPPQEIVNAGTEYLAARDKAILQPSSKTNNMLFQTEKHLQTTIDEHATELVALHAKEHADCPWDQSRRNLLPRPSR